MRKKIFIVAFMVILFIFTNAKASLGFSIELTLDKLDHIQQNDEVTLIVQLDEKIQGASFMIDYDNDNLDLIGSNTENLKVGKKNGQIACMYFIMDGEGTDKLEIKFKVTGTKNKLIVFNMKDAKFITISGKEYRVDDLSNKSSNIEEVTNKVEENKIEDKPSNTNKTENPSNDNQNKAKAEPSKGQTKNNESTSTTKKVVVNNINDGLSKDDTPKTVKKIPQTGDNNYYLLLGAVITSILMVYSFIKMRKTK